MWPGIATDRIGKDGRDGYEMLRQVEMSRDFVKLGGKGHIHWNIKSLRTNSGSISSILLKGPYKDIALVPASPWLEETTEAVMRGETDEFLTTSKKPRVGFDELVN